MALSLSVAESPTTPPTPTGHQGDVFVIIINVCDSLSRVVGVSISTPFPPSSFPNPFKKKLKKGYVQNCLRSSFLYATLCLADHRTSSLMMMMMMMMMIMQKSAELSQSSTFRSNKVFVKMFYLLLFFFFLGCSFLSGWDPLCSVLSAWA